MPGGEVDPKSVQYAAQMKSWSSKSGARPDKHARQQQGQARRYAGLARPLWQLREQMRRQLLLILHWLPATSDLALHCRRLLRNIDRALGRIHSVSAQGHSGGSGGGGGDSSSPPGRGPPVTQMLPMSSCVDVGFGGERRAFLQLGGKMVLVVAGIAAGLKPDLVFASSKAERILEQLRETKFNEWDLSHLKKEVIGNWNKLPPGFANSRDRYLGLVYGEVIENHFNFGVGVERLKPSSISLEGFTRNQIAWQTPYLEPALYFLREKLSNTNGYEFDENFKIINLPLAHFALGVKHYFTYWHRRHLLGMNTSPQEIEKNFLNSIFAAAYMDQTETKKQETLQLYVINQTKNFLDLNSFYEKEEKLKEVMRILEKLPKDKTSCDPNDGYNRSLVAAWSSFMLVNQYWLSSKKENDVAHNNMGLINKNVEIPIRKYIPKIRGEPYYFNDRI